MRRGISRWEVPLAVLAAATLLLPTAAQQPFSSNTNLVVVPVVAVDNKGKPVIGLEQSDFSVFEDGKPVAVQTFVAPEPSGVTGEAGRFRVVVLDNNQTRTAVGFRV